MQNYYITIHVKELSSRPNVILQRRYSLALIESDSLNSVLNC